MKNKISFTSVLKSKASMSSRMMNASSQHSINNNDSSQQQSRYQPQQYQHERLIDIYQQYQCYPEQEYTLDFNRIARNLRTRNNSLSNVMSKSNKNVVSDDPEMSLEMWIESQKKGTYEGYPNGSNFSSGNITNGSSVNSNSRFTHQQQQQKGYNHNQQLIVPQQQLEQQQQLYLPPMNRRSRSTYNPPSTSNKNIYYQQNQHMQSSSSLQSQDEQQLQQLQRYNQPTQQSNNNGFISGKWNKRSPTITNQTKPQLLNPQTNNLNQLQSSSQSSNHHHEENSSSLSSNKITPQDYLAEEMLRSKSHYPSELQDRDYDKLKEEFERLKGEKITELCMQAKKTIKKDKLREIVNKALENIYDDIERIAEKMVEEKRKKSAMKENMITKKLSNPHQQHSQSMLISGGGYQAEESSQLQLDQSNYQQQQQQQQQQTPQLQQTDRAQQQRRQQELRNMIKGYISGIQQAKTQGNLVRSKQQHHEIVSNNKDSMKQHQGNKPASIDSPQWIKFQQHQQQIQLEHEQHSFSNTNYQDNTFNNQFMTNFNTASQQSSHNNSNNQCSDNNSAIDCVGYSFANNNVTLGCEHSFNRDLTEGNGNNNSGMFYHNYNSNMNDDDDDNYHQSGFSKHQQQQQQHPIKPQVYQPEQQSMYEQQQQQEQHKQQRFHPQHQSTDPQQRISLPNIEQVKSESGQFPHQQQSNLHSQIESSQLMQGQFRNQQMQNYNHIDYENDNNNIKNIESVHYEPPASESKYHGGYFEFNEGNSRNMMHNNNSRKDLFKNFQEQSEIINQQLNQPEINKPIIDQKSPNTSQEQRFVSKTFTSYLNGQMRGEYGVSVKESVKDNIGNMNKYSIGSNNSISMPTTMHISPISVYSPRATTPQSFQQPHPTPTSESMNMSLNQSIGSNPLIQRLSSPKSSYHILQSKNKFSISSPMKKIQEIMSQEEEYVMIRGNSISESGMVNEFPCMKASQSHGYKLTSPAYAVSTSLTTQDKIQEPNFKNNSQNIYAMNKVSTFNQYACSESINNDNNNNNSINFNFNKNSTQIQHIQQPSSMSVKSSSSMDYNNSSSSNNRMAVVANQQQSQQFNVNNNSNNNLFEMKPLIMMSSNNQSINNISSPKLAQSIELSHPLYTIAMPTSPKQQQSITITYGNNRTSPPVHPTITSGRNFLKSLHQKQSIELSPSPNHSPSSSNYNGKESFAAQTFRPLKEIDTYTNSNQLSFNSNSSNNNNKEVMINGSNSNKNNTKLSITKITLKSSDKNQTTSPKVISLTVNHLQSQKQPPIQEFNLTNNDTKQNVFQKLTIKQSINNNSNNISMSLRNSQSFGGLKQHTNYVNLGLKQNSNTMNNSIQNNNNMSDWKKQSMNQERLKESLSMVNNNPKSSITTIQKKQPLIKLSKNFTIPSTQQSSFNIKKSIGQSIRTKVHQPGMMISTKPNMGNDFGTGQSFNKYAMKQSIGNDSDMDFDLELD